METPFGLHLLRVEEVREARVKSLEEVRDEIEADLRLERAREIAGEAAKADRASVARGGDLAAVAQARGLELQKPDPRPRNSPYPGLGSSIPFSTALWEAQPGTLLEPTSVNGTWVVARVIERLPAGTQPFDQARERVETELRREQGTDLARKAAEEFLARAVTVGSLRDLAKKEEREVEESGEILRAGRYVPGIGGSDELKVAVARLADDDRLAKQVFVVAGDSFVVELLERTRPDDAKIAEQMDEARSNLLARKQQEVFSRFVDELKSRAPIQLFPDRLDQLPAV